MVLLQTATKRLQFFRNRVSLLVCVVMGVLILVSALVVWSGNALSRLSFLQAHYTVVETGISGNTNITVTLDNAVGGEQINWSIVSPGGNNGATLGEISSMVSGTTATVTVSGNNVQRSVTIMATLASDSTQSATATVQFGESLPKGFLTGPLDSSSNAMRWQDAKNYCERQGGHLPKTNADFTQAEGFGNVGLGYPWPAGLKNWPHTPSARYWTDTIPTSPGITDGAFNVYVYGDSMSFSIGSRLGTRFAVCVP